MKIALTHTRYSYTGGIEKYIHSLVERLLAGGHEVHYIARQWEPHEHPNLHFHHAPMIRFPKSLRVLSFNRSVNRVLAREDFDLVHGFTKTDRQDIYTDGSGLLYEYTEATLAHRSAWYRTLYRATPHQRAILRMESRRFQRGAIRMTIPMAEFLKRQILARYPVEPERIEVVYNGVELEHFQPHNRATLGATVRERLGIDPGRPVLLFVGNDWFRKGLDTTLDALPAIAEQLATPPVLLVAGHDNHPERFHQQARERGVYELVEWLGPTREIREPFAAADAFLFPSRYDAFGNVGLEALASGVPAALSAAAGVGEVLDGGDAGVLLRDPTDAAELTRAAVRLLDPQRLPARRAAARTLAEKFSWDRHFERILEIYDQVLAEKRAERN